MKTRPATLTHILLTYPSPQIIDYRHDGFVDAIPKKAGNGIRMGAEAINAKVRVRPLRLGCLIKPNDRAALRRVIEVNTCLWGGIFNFIIPLLQDSVTLSRPAISRSDRERVYQRVTGSL